MTQCHHNARALPPDGRPLLGDVLDVGFGNLPGGEEIGVVDGPSVKVLLVEFRRLQFRRLHGIIIRDVRGRTGLPPPGPLFYTKSLN
jgi:hypothetical protein